MTLFITGIGTDVGKTIASAIVTEALEADYWKPIQAGDIENSDSHKIKNLISNQKTIIHPGSYILNTPASPHYAAQRDGITIDLKKITPPKPLVIKTESQETNIGMMKTEPLRGKFYQKP